MSDSGSDIESPEPASGPVTTPLAKRVCPATDTATAPIGRLAKLEAEIATTKHRVITDEILANAGESMDYLAFHGFNALARIAR
ncbi:hypothetical protein KIPB_002525 [Kipferlia bialata]|uniref:Uncharacterized protein n=1 Tax=Kipferlia bialata TaxID=797122 RepID=A0A391NJE9_9EUKA|nr:hypothetical protein KIPB_002525 [Kipferlia bialata]|eukprot:g2525.t1